MRKYQIILNRFGSADVFIDGKYCFLVDEFTDITTNNGESKLEFLLKEGNKTCGPLILWNAGVRAFYFTGAIQIHDMRNKTPAEAAERFAWLCEGKH